MAEGIRIYRPNGNGKFGSVFYGVLIEGTTMLKGLLEDMPSELTPEKVDKIEEMVRAGRIRIFDLKEVKEVTIEELEEFRNRLSAIAKRKGGRGI